MSTNTVCVWHNAADKLPPDGDEDYAVRFRDNDYQQWNHSSGNLMEIKIYFLPKWEQVQWQEEITHEEYMKRQGGVPERSLKQIYLNEAQYNEAPNLERTMDCKTFVRVVGQIMKPVAVEKYINVEGLLEQIASLKADKQGLVNALTLSNSLARAALPAKGEGELLSDGDLAKERETLMYGKIEHKPPMLKGEGELREAEIERYIIEFIWGYGDNWNKADLSNSIKAQLEIIVKIVKHFESKLLPSTPPPSSEGEAERINNE